MSKVFIDDRSHLPSEVFDAVRGLAALYVMLFHARLLLLISVASVAALGLHGWVRVEIAALAPTRYGHVAVLAFFVVSGYAIHYRQAARLSAGDSQVIRWTTYLWHRVRRLYPPLIIALGVTFLADQLGAHFDPGFYNHGAPDPDLGFIQGPTFRDLLGTLLFVQGVVTVPFGTNSPLWSLSFEAFYYVTYPLVLAVNRRLGPSRCLIVFGAVGLSSAVISHLGSQASILAVLQYWPLWVGGAFLADARAGRVTIPERLLNTSAWVGLGLLLGLASFFIVEGLHRGVVFERLAAILGDGWWAVALFGPLGWLAAGKRRPDTRARITRLCVPLMRVGSMSYSLYIVHFPVLLLLSALWLAHHDRLPATPWLYLAGIAAALALSFAVYWVAERPLLSRRRFHLAGAPLKVNTPATAERPAIGYSAALGVSRD